MNTSQSLAPRLYLDRVDDVAAATGRKCAQRVYDDIAAGTMTRPIKHGRTSVWPRYEHQAISAARIAGATDDELRALVEELHGLRKRLSRLPGERDLAA